ncbi:MAG: hypothetical protein MSG64_17435 [Pyrinomonadaceae bacterium MAG19_C2-C3]|nr:hypothetical protein [Pyrinomonadaceae bacterium MAG19_C2-C3]
MNEDTTKELPNNQSFEERIFKYLEAMEARMEARMKAEMLEMEGRMKADTLEMKIVINDINRRLTTLEEKVERRLYDTRPIWEGVQAQLVEVLARLTSIETRVVSIETRVEHIDAKIDIINKEILTMRADHLQLQRRVTRIEEDLQQPH